MAYVNFKNLPSEETPLTGGASGNLNVMQENGTTHGSDTKLGYSQAFLNEHILNVSNEVDEDYRVNFSKGKNLLSTSLELGTFNNSGAKDTSTTNYRTANMVKVRPNTTYTTSINGTAQAYAVYFYTSGGIYISSATTATFTTPANCEYLNFRCFNADFTSDFANLKVQIEEGNTATSYEPYITPSIVVDNEEIYSKDNLEQYSTGEIRIGTWIDGKPLYRKVVKTVMGTCTTNGTYGPANRYTVDANAKIKNFYGTIPLGGGVFPIFYADSAGRFVKVASDDGKVLVLSTNATFFSGANCEITVEYTKTTD